MTRDTTGATTGRAAVVGGSIGGLTAALLLRRLGWSVDVYERTPVPLTNRGGGIVLQPETLRWFDQHGARRVEELATTTRRLRYLGPDDAVVHDEEVSWSFTSWSTIHGALGADFGEERYHLGESLVGLDQDADGVDLRFASGRRERAQLVVLADGITSVGRRRLMPEVVPTYSGYVGWRGTVPESRLPARVLDVTGDALTYGVGQQTHLVLYPIPGAEGRTAPRERLLNYVWYRNVAEGPALDELMTDVRGIECPVSLHPGAVQPRFVEEMRAAATQLLAPTLAEVIHATEQPFLQVVLDVRSPQVAHGRVALLGDAAFAARPHAAAGSAKAADDAWALHDHLAAQPDDVPGALRAWEPGRLAVGNALLDRVRTMGERSQVLGTWDPTDPALRFGLREPAVAGLALH